MEAESERDLVVLDDPDRPTGRRRLPATTFTTLYGAMLRPLHAVGWTRVRLAAYAAYAAVLIGIVVVVGVPTGRISLAIIIMLGLALTSVGHGWRNAGRVFLDWLPFTLVLVLYDRTRSVVDTFGVTLHEKDILDAERWFFAGTEPTVWLQHHLYNPSHVYWYDAICTLVYTSHFLATPILAAVLWLRDRAVWLRYISRVILLSVAGLVTYCVFPEAPPWFAARDGFTEPVSRLSARGWTWFHLGNVHETLERAQQDGTNPVAAMPSLHTAFATLVAIVAITQLRSRWRWLAALYPVAMGFTLVYSGEHYVLDLVAGALYAGAAYVAMSRWEAWRRRRLVRAADLTAPVKVGAVVSGGASGADGT
ncbi:MAG: phosphatase PAP2 family protein [Jatrophihabitans sp.]